MDSTIDQVIDQVCRWIDISTGPMTNNVDRIDANTKLNDMINTVIYTNPELYLKVALGLIGKLNNNERYVHDYLLEIYVHYGFKVINDLIKFSWYNNINANIKEELKDSCIQWCNSRLFSRYGGNLAPNRISTSTLVLNSCSNVIAEIFIREWPNNWTNFFNGVTERTSLVTLYTFLNISDLIHNSQMPNNSMRRKELRSALSQNHEIIYSYFQKTLAIMESDIYLDVLLTLEYKQMVIIKSFETLDSLFEWFQLNETIINRIIYIAASLAPNLDSRYSYRLKMIAYKCIQTLVQQINMTNPENSELLCDIFYNFSADKFLFYFITHSLRTYFNYRHPIESHTELFDLCSLVLNIACEIMCQVIVLYNKKTTNSKMRKNITHNQELWSSFLNFIVSCLMHNNAILDDIALKFLLLYCKLRHGDSTLASSSSSSSALISHGKVNLISPIDASVDHKFPMQILTLVGQCKTVPKPEPVANKCELRVSMQIDSYQCYCNLFLQNCNKFKMVIFEFAQHEREICQTYVTNMFHEIRNSRSEMDSKVLIQTGVRTWSVVSTMCSAIIPKIAVTPEFTPIIEAYFVFLLNEIKDQNKDQSTLSDILSILSSMSNFYVHFSHEHIELFLSQIFEFTLKNKGNLNFNRDQELQNHAGALFIKLSVNCSNTLLPFFDLMRDQADKLWADQAISSTQFCSLYEGLIIMSNHFPMLEDQRKFIYDHLLPKIKWVITYDSGINGLNFFRDIGLNKEPDFTCTAPTLSVNRTFCEAFLSLNLLNRLFKRISPGRCLAIAWTSIFDYITPFYKLITAINTLWYIYRTNDEANLDQLVHPFYRKFIFVEASNLFLNMTCSDRLFLVPPDRLKTHFLNWDRQTPPLPDMIGLHTQQRLEMLFTQTLAFLSNSLNYVFFYYSTYPTSEIIVETFLKNSLQQMFINIKSLPFIYYYDFIKTYLRNLVSYCPRNEKFLQTTEIVTILNGFLPFLFTKLDQKFKLLQQEKVIELESSEPNRTVPIVPNISIQKKNDEKKLEMCMEIVHNVIGQEFIYLLREIFNEPKNINHWASKFQLESQHKQIQNMDDENMDDDMNEFVENDTIKKSVVRVEDNDSYLSKYMISNNAFPMVNIVTNCLLWPLGVVRPAISEVNITLVHYLLARGAINSVDRFYYLADRIIRAINLTEKNDSNAINSFLSLFTFLYEKVVVKNRLTEIVNPQLAQICSVETVQWDNFAQSLSVIQENQDRKRQQKNLKLLLKNVYLKEISQLHSLSKPELLCLGDNSSTKQNVDSSAENDTDTLSLAWLF